MHTLSMHTVLESKYGYESYFCKQTKKLVIIWLYAYSRQQKQQQHDELR